MLSGATIDMKLSNGALKFVHDIPKVDEQMKFLVAMTDFSRTYKQYVVPQFSRILQRTNTEELADLYLYDISKMVAENTKAVLLNVTTVVDGRNSNATVLTYGYRFDKELINATNAVVYI